MPGWRPTAPPLPPPHSVTSGRSAFGRCDRVTLAQPFGVQLGIPGDPSLDTAARIDTLNLGTLAQFATGVLTPALTVTQDTQNLGPVRAIEIASDSPIASCDLWIGDTTIKNRYRIGIGRPWIGDLTELDHVLVTLPVSIPPPFFSTENLNDLPDNPVGDDAKFVARNYIWDAMDVRPGTPGFVTAVNATMPLRLELYRGELPPFAQLRRAPYPADFIASIPSAESVADPTAHRTLWLITDGRALVEFQAWNLEAANPIIVTVHGHESAAGFNATQSGGISHRLDRFVVTGNGAGAGPAGANMLYQGRARRVYRDRFALYSFRMECPANAGYDIGASFHVVARDE